MLSIICSSLFPPKVATTIAWVSPLVNNEEPCTLGNKDVSISNPPSMDSDMDDDISQVHQPKPVSRPFSNGNGKDQTARKDIFVTGVVGRSMGSGHFNVEDINDLTKNAVKSFNENLA